MRHFVRCDAHKKYSLFSPVSQWYAAREGKSLIHGTRLECKLLRPGSVTETNSSSRCSPTASNKKIRLATVFEASPTKMVGVVVANPARDGRQQPTEIVGRLSQVCERWIYSACLCFALDLEEQQRSGFRYQYSVYQIEYSRNLIFHRGAQIELRLRLRALSEGRRDQQTKAEKIMKPGKAKNSNAESKVW